MTLTGTTFKLGISDCQKLQLLRWFGRSCTCLGETSLAQMTRFTSCFMRNIRLQSGCFSVCRNHLFNPHLSLSVRLFQHVINTGITLCSLKLLYIHRLHKFDRMKTVIFITPCFPLPWIIVIWLHSLSRMVFCRFISSIDCRRCSS